MFQGSGALHEVSEGFISVPLDLTPPKGFQGVSRVLQCVSKHVQEFQNITGTFQSFRGVPRSFSVVSGDFYGFHERSIYSVDFSSE